MLEPDEGVCALGTASETGAGWDTRGYVIDEPTTDGDFVLSDESEARLVKEGKRGGLVFVAFGGLLTVVVIGVAGPSSRPGVNSSELNEPIHDRRAPE